MLMVAACDIYNAPVLYAWLSANLEPSIFKLRPPVSADCCIQILALFALDLVKLELIMLIFPLLF